MINTTSFKKLFTEIRKVYEASDRIVFLVLVAGCSRSGKTTLASKLSTQFREEGINSIEVGLDSWLIGVDDRKQDSTVLERYEMTKINTDIEILLQGGLITPPVYDPVSRKRVIGKTGESLQIKKGIVIVEGVVALSDSSLLAKKGISVFVKAPHLTRIKRLLDFYGRIKKMPKEDYKQIIREREKEEVLFINRTAVFADLLYMGSN